MTTLVIPANYYQVAFHHQITGSLREAVVVWGLHYSGADFVTDAQTVSDAWGTTMVQSMADAWNYTHAVWRNQIGTVADIAEGVAGGTAHTPTTPNVAFLFHKITGAPGRRARGRMYLPGVSEQDVDGVGVVVGSKETELVGNLNAWGVARNAAHFLPYLLHRDTGDPVADAPTAISSIALDNMCATMRRRLRR